jgi:hypothetical protein
VRRGASAKIFFVKSLVIVRVLTLLGIPAGRSRPARAKRFRKPVSTLPRVRFVLSAMLLCHAHGSAQLGPQPPCGKEPVPPYPGLEESAIVKSWNKSDLGRDWRPPACTGWATVGFTTLVTVVARFRHISEAEGLLRHVAAISELKGMRY